MPGCEVWQHSVAAAEVARCLIYLRPELKEMLSEGIVSLIGIHDVGKISPGFQTKCAMWHGPEGRTDEQTLKSWAMQFDGNHAYISQGVVQEYYREVKKCKSYRYWGKCVGAHHGTPLDGYTALLETRLPEDWKQDCYALIEFIENKYGSLPEVKLKESLTRVMCGLMIVSDWIASNELCFPASRQTVSLEKCARNALAMIGMSQVPEVNRGKSWKDLFQHCPLPHPIQRHMWSLSPAKGIYVIEDSMGGGKTEAALAFAYRMLEKGAVNGIYFALPTQTTSNRIFLRMRDFINNCGVQTNAQSMQLAHGNSWMMRDSLYETSCANFLDEKIEYFNELSSWFASTKRALLAPFGVGTIDQALMGVVAVKHRDVRAFALAGKMVILDEVHSYDFYTGSLLTALVKQLRESAATIVILSATLTRRRTAEILGIDVENLPDSGYPLVTSLVDSHVSSMAFPSSSTKTIKLQMQELLLADTVSLAYDRALKGECVLWICNTVSSAQDVYAHLKAEAVEDGPEIGLLHARFPYWRREELEKRWITALGRDASLRPSGCVLVATQVVEQSVDIDADFLITELAPTDMLLQRAGRLWRHQRDTRPCPHAEMLVTIPVGLEAACRKDSYQEFLRVTGSSSKVYSPFVLWRTWSILRGKHQIVLPVDIRQLIESTYSDENTEICCIATDAFQELQNKRRAMEQASQLNQTFAAGVAADQEGVFTRYGDVPSADILLLKSSPVNKKDGKRVYVPLFGAQIEVSNFSWEFEVAKSISMNKVRIPAYLIKDLKPDPLLQKYASNGGIYPFFLLENGDLKWYSDGSSRLAWNVYSGVVILPYEQNNEAESEFMY